MLLVGLLFAVQSYAQVYYVDAAAADDSGNGLTPVTAKRTINAAIALASGTATATINIAKGNYPENVVINKDNITLLGDGSGSNLNGAPVAPDAGLHTIITGGAAGKGIQVSGARTNITVKGIAIVGYSAEGFLASAGSSNIFLENLQVNGNCTAGAARGGVFFSGGANNVTVTGCAVQNNGPGASARAIGIWDGHKANVTITNNYVIFTNCCGIDLNDGTSSGVNISNNTLIAGSASSDSAIGVLGMKAGIGANIIAVNNITVAKRYGIEIKNPAGSGLDDESAAGAIIVKNNIINRLDAGSAVIGAEARDLAGIAVFRRSFTSGNPSGYVDVPSGVVIKGNTVSGFQQPNANGEGYGIVVEGVKMTIANNTVSNCNVGIQRQAGNASNYVKNNTGDADQAAISNYFGRGNSPLSAAITLTGNTLSSNGVDTRDEFALGTYLGDAQYVYNSTQKVNYVTINLGVEYATASDVLQLSAHTFDELVVVNKAVTIDGVDKSNRTITYTGAAITGGSITPALFKVTSPNVTIKNLTMNVDLTKIWSAIISSGDVAGLTVTSNEIKAIRTATSNAAGYTDRNAIGINISGRAIPGVTNAVNPSGVITVTNNTVSYTPDPTPANVAAFRAAVAVDNYNVFVEGNTTAVVNHDVTNRFQTTAGQSIVRNNTFNGGGVEFSEPNATSGGVLVEGNDFDYLLGGFPTFALVRFKNNDQNKPFSFKNNQVRNHYWLMSLENFQNIDVEGNTFTPIKNASDYFQIISVNTKTISSSANTKLPLAANIIGNTFNGVSGAIGAKGIAFYNHDNGSPQFGSFVIGAPAKQNTFNDNINHYLYVDNNNGNATKDVGNVGMLGYPEYGGNIGLTTTGYWATNIRADQNNFFVDGQLRAVSSLTPAQRLLLDAKIFDKEDDVNVGKVQYYFPVRNQTTTEGFATIQSAVDAATTNDVLKVDEGTYAEKITINKKLTINGPNVGKTGVDATRVTEAKIISPSTDLALASVPLVRFVAGSENSVFDGFEVNGDNPALTGSGIMAGGVEVDAAYGISVLNVGGVTIQNNIVQNFGSSEATPSAYLVGAETTTTPMSGITVARNLLRNLNQSTTFASMDAVTLNNDVYAQILDNKFVDVRGGIQFVNAYRPNPLAGTFDARIANNDITSYRLGLYYNLQYSNASAWTVENNTFKSSTPIGGNTRYEAIRVESIQGSTVNGNIIGNTIIGNKTARETENPSFLTYGISFHNNVNTAGVFLVKNNNISEVKHGIGYTGSGTSTLTSNVRFTGGNIFNVTNYVTYEISSATPTFANINLPSTQLDGKTGDQYTVSELADIYTNKIIDKDDNVGYGKVYLVFNVKNLTQGTAFATIQDAIDDVLTVNADVIDVKEGTYTLMDAVKITKSVTLQGNNNVTATKPVINGVGGVTSKALVEVDAANVTIKNFEFQIAQQGDALVGVSSTTTDNFNNLSIEDNLFKGMKGYATGYVWASYAMKLGRGSAGVVGGVLNNKINVVRNTVSYNTPSTPELFGRGIYAFNTYDLNSINK